MELFLAELRLFICVVKVLERLAHGKSIPEATLFFEQIEAPGCPSIR